VLLGAAPFAMAQAIPTATRPADIQIGFGFTSARPDYQHANFPGFAIYADVDPRAHWGIEAEYHQVFSSTGDQSQQRTAEIGGRYFRNYGPFSPYGKGMYGRGNFKYPFGFTQLNYNILAAAGGVDYKATRYIHARVEYEYQHWLGFQNGGLNPQLITFGVAYHFDGKPRYKNH
jgi:opacity protein-like surface antigen